MAMSNMMAPKITITTKPRHFKAMNKVDHPVVGSVPTGFVGDPRFNGWPHAGQFAGICVAGSSPWQKGHFMAE